MAIEQAIGQAIELELGVVITIALGVIGAWWAIAVIAIKQFESRQDEKFIALQDSINGQQDQLDGHLTKQDNRERQVLADIRNLEAELARCQLDAANRYQTKEDAGHHFAALVLEIRALGSRIDALHGRGVGMS